MEKAKSHKRKIKLRQNLIANMRKKNDAEIMRRKIHEKFLQEAIKKNNNSPKSDDAQTMILYKKYKKVMKPQEIKKKSQDI